MSGNERPTFYREVEDRPPKFITRNEAEKRWMFEWVCSRLHDWAEDHEWAGTHLDGLLEEQLEEAYEAVRRGLEDDDVAEALRAAEQGDVEPLRSMYPQIARFIKLPKRADHSTWRKRAERRWPPYPPRAPEDGVELTKEEVAEAEKAARRDWIELAVAEAFIVRAIWKGHYDRTNQPQKDGQLTPAEIVAERWGVTPEEVLERLKRLKRTS